MAALIRHRHKFTKSLEEFYRVLPEFHQGSIESKSLVDKAVQNSILEPQTSKKFWKDFRTQFMQANPSVSPREIARLKFALTHSTEDLNPVFWGRETFHNWIDSKLSEHFSHLNATEYLSVLAAFGKFMEPEVFADTVSKLSRELKEEQKLGLYSAAPYVSSYFMPRPQSPVPTKPYLECLQALKELFGVVCPLMEERVTELTDDQLTLALGGFEASSLKVKDREVFYPLLDAFDSDILARRTERLSAMHCIDLIRGFAAVNYVSEEAFAKLKNNVFSKTEDLEFEDLLMLGYGVTLRDELSQAEKSAIEKALKGNIQHLKSDKLELLAKYILASQTSDQEIIKQTIQRVELEKWGVSEHEFQSFRKLHFYIEKHFPKLLTEEFQEKCDRKGHLFIAENLMTENEELESKEFKLAANWIRSYMNYNCFPGYLDRNYDFIHFAFMPGNTALMLAFPHAHLKGKHFYDTRIIKEPKLKFEITNEFKTRCRWLETLGWNVLPVNYYDLVHNFDSFGDRDAFLEECLSKFGAQKLA